MNTKKNMIHEKNTKKHSVTHTNNMTYEYNKKMTQHMIKKTTRHTHKYDKKKKTTVTMI